MTKPITTTLKAIHSCIDLTDKYCLADWEKLLKHLDKTEPDDEQLKFSTILEAVGVFIYKCLESLPDEYKPLLVMYWVDVAELMLQFFEVKVLDDKRPREAIQAIRDYAEGKITEEELHDKRKAALVASLLTKCIAARESPLCISKAIWLSVSKTCKGPDKAIWQLDAYEEAARYIKGASDEKAYFGILFENARKSTDELLIKRFG